MRRKKQLTSPVRLGLLLTEEATELSELSEEALGLRLSGVGSTLRTAGLALAGVVEGKPILVTLCTGANRPYLGWHWKYLPREKQAELKCFSWRILEQECESVKGQGSHPHCSVILFNAGFGTGIA